MDNLPSNNAAVEYYRLWHKIEELYEIYAKSFGISSSTLAVVCIINQYKGKCTQKLICERSFLPKQTVNAVISDFLKQGIIELAESKSDRRTKIIHLTNIGKKYVNGITRKLINAEEKAMGSLTKEQIVELLNSTNIYYNSFKETITNAIEIVTQK